MSQERLQALFDALRAECVPVRGRLGRYAARLSRAIRRTLVALRLDAQNAAELAHAVTGTNPDDWLTAREAHAEVRRLGVRRSRRWLYRLAKKFHGASGEVFVDARGEWGAPEQVKNPVATVKVMPCSPPRFRVEAVTTTVSNTA